MSRYEILQPPNLVSLSRVILAPVIGYYLFQPEPQAAFVALALVIVAGVTDALDGFLARKMNLVGPMGIALDPVCDKIFAGLLVILLIPTRDLPIWLAAVIIGRDLLILAAGSLLMSGRKISLPSNLTGKWAFAAIAVLLACYVVRFQFGIWMIGPIALLLIAGSLFGYGRVFIKVRRGETPQPFADRPVYKITRVVLTLLVAAIFLNQFYTFLFK
ncbi:MAG TPA: CDP-alcohol phosphatidyltransferase family protein [candidate division Zixibacteria bacterium]|nr:CDP-alcohol phosphatidyltransferase family protein [candidate division Zixibacteria bacterium]